MFNTSLTTQTLHLWCQKPHIRRLIHIKLLNSPCGRIALQCIKATYTQLTCNAWAIKHVSLLSSGAASPKSPNVRRYSMWQGKPKWICRIPHFSVAGVLKQLCSQTRIFRTNPHGFVRKALECSTWLHTVESSHAHVEIHRRVVRTTEFDHYSQRTEVYSILLVTSVSEFLNLSLNSK